MNKKMGLAPIDKDEQIFNMIWLVFSGLHRNKDSQLEAGADTSKFLEKDVFKAIYELSKEFPDFFPYYSVKMNDGVPYNSGLDDILSSLVGSSILSLSDEGNGQSIIIGPIAKRIMAKNLLSRYSKEEIETLLLVVSRFDEIMGSKVAK